MPGKLPIDRVREATDVPETYDRHRERFSEAEAARRDADDPVSGAQPGGEGDDATPGSHDEDENANA